MIGLELDSLNNDIILTGSGGFRRSSGRPYIAQRVESILRMFEGESSVDPNLGIPYFSPVFDKPADIFQISALIKTEILAVPEVLSFNSFNLDYNVDTRIMDLTFEAVTTEGTIAINGFGIPTGDTPAPRPVEEMLVDDSFEDLTDNDLVPLII